MTHPRKVALVTGAARRIGAVIATQLHVAGFDIALHYRDSASDALALAAALTAARADSALPIQGRLEDDTVAGRLVATTVERWGRLDALVNNASIYRPTPLGAVTTQDWFEIMSVNLRAPFLLAQAAAPHLAAGHGAIVNITDVYGERPLPHHTVYSISKAGLIMLTRSLAVELGPDVRVNGVSPGAVLWPDQVDSAHVNAILRKTVLERTGSPDDIARAVAFLIDAPYITGQILAVDGGRLLYI